MELKVYFGIDQDSMIDRVLAKIKGRYSKMTKTLIEGNIGGLTPREKMWEYLIDFNTPYDIYLFGHLQAKGTNQKESDNLFG